MLPDAVVLLHNLHIFRFGNPPSSLGQQLQNCHVALLTQGTVAEHMQIIPVQKFHLVTAQSACAAMKLLIFVRYITVPP